MPKQKARRSDLQTKISRLESAVNNASQIQAARALNKLYADSHSPEITKAIIDALRAKFFASGITIDGLSLLFQSCRVTIIMQFSADIISWIFAAISQEDFTSRIVHVTHRTVFTEKLCLSVIDWLKNDPSTDTGIIPASQRAAWLLQTDSSIVIMVVKQCLTFHREVMDIIVSCEAYIEWIYDKKNTEPTQHYNRQVDRIKLALASEYPPAITPILPDLSVWVFQSSNFPVQLRNLQLVIAFGYRPAVDAVASAAVEWAHRQPPSTSGERDSLQELISDTAKRYPSFAKTEQDYQDRQRTTVVVALPLPDNTAGSSGLGFYFFQPGGGPSLQEVSGHQNPDEQNSDNPLNSPNFFT